MLPSQPGFYGNLLPRELLPDIENYKLYNQVEIAVKETGMFEYELVVTVTDDDNGQVIFTIKTVYWFPENGSDDEDEEEIEKRNLEWNALSEEEREQLYLVNLEKRMMSTLKSLLDKIHGKPSPESPIRIEIEPSYNALTDSHKYGETFTLEHYLEYTKESVFALYLEYTKIIPRKIIQLYRPYRPLPLLPPPPKLQPKRYSIVQIGKKRSAILLEKLSTINRDLINRRITDTTSFGS